MNNIIVKYILYIWVLTFFLAPREGVVSFVELRVLCLVLLIPFIFSKKLYMLITGLVILINIYTFLNYGLAEFSYWYILLPYFFISNVIRMRIEFSKNFFYFLIFSFGATLFFNFFTYGNLVSNSQDPNYTGLQIILLYLLSKTLKNKFLSFFFLLIGILTYSRLFIISIPIILILDFLKFKSFSNKVKGSLFLFHIIIYSLFIVLNYLFMKFIFGGDMPDHVQLNGINRLDRMIDTSNWIRIKANLVFFEGLNFERLFLGELYGQSIDIEGFSEKSIYPHNLLFSMIYNSGIIISLLFLKVYTKLIANFSFSLIVTMLIYQLILGFGVFYGHILITLCFMVIFANQFEKSLSKN